MFLRLDKVQKAKHGIAVKRERARQSHCILLSSLVGSKQNVGRAFSPTPLNCSGWNMIDDLNSKLLQK